MRKRERYIPTGFAKVADKQSSALVYIGLNRRGKPAAIGYSGKRGKADFHHYFLNEKDRETYVTRYFQSIRQSEEIRQERHQQRKAATNSKLFIGAILETRWGYDQTNIEYFQVTALVGTKMVELRELKRAVKPTGWARDDVYPVFDEFMGETIRRRVDDSGTGVKIDDVRRAWLWKGQVGKTTSYA